MKLVEMKLELKKLQTQIDEITLDDKGEKREDVTMEEYGKVQGLLDQQDELVNMIKTEERMEKSREELREPVEEPVTKEDPPEKDNSKEWDSFGEYLQAVYRASRPGGQFDPRLRESRAITGQGETIPADGGFVVGTDFVNEMLDNARKTGVMAAKCRKISLSSNANSISIPGVDEASRANGSRWGGIQGYWLEEGGTKTASTMTFRRIQINLSKVVVMVYATDELLQDQSALGSWIGDKASAELGFKLDDAIIEGTGVGMPLGVKNANCLVGISKETGQAATTIVAENLEKMYSRMDPFSMPRAEWYMNQDCWPQIFKLHHAVGTGGIPVFVPAGGLSGAPYGTLFGRKINVIEQAESLGTKGDIYFADFSRYILIDKGGIQSAMSIHVSFTTDQTVFRFVYRVGGQPDVNSALTPFKGGSNTVSPFIALNVRS